MIGKFKAYIKWWLYKGLYKPGHYYSPTPSLKDIEQNSSVISQMSSLRAIYLRQEEQKRLLEQMKVFISDFDWPEKLHSSHRYYYNNIFFNQSDAFVLYALLRIIKPHRVVEIGSGFSSVLMMDTNERYLNNSLKITLIEPFPDRVKSLMHGNDTTNPQYSLLTQTIQTAPLNEFHRLKKNDILFVDSSHISKYGSDLNHILFNILPQLNPGVIIHFHDVTFPFEYPLEWLKQGIYWNEAYLLRAFLMYNNSFEIMLMNHLWKDSALKELSVINKGGGSLWLRKISA